MEEKDLFDLFREGSENLSEQPSQETWQRLETRLARRRTVAKPRPLLLQLNVVVTVVLLLLGIAAVGLVVAREQEAANRATRQFQDLQFLVGRWSASEGKIGDELQFEVVENSKNTKILRGVKTLFFNGSPVAKDTILFQKTGKNLTLKAFGANSRLTKQDKDTYFFEDVHLQKLADDRFSVSVGAGQVFLYRRMP
jgi:hypothetical protein